MPVSITLSIRLGPLVTLKMAGQNCQELARALEGYDDLNVRINSMCGDLAERIYPEGIEPETMVSQEEDETGQEDEP